MNLNNSKSKWSSLFTTNFLGVFNDNFLKSYASFVIIFWVSEQYQTLLVTLAAALFVLPYIIFSPLAGNLAKKYLKVKIVQSAKLAEIPIMIIAIIGFYTKIEGVVIFSIFLMGLQSALFSPAKYGLIRDIGGVQQVSFGSGVMETVSFGGVLLGTFLAAILSDGYSIYFAMGVLLLLSILGYVASLTLKVGETAVEKVTESTNPVLFVRDAYREAKNFKGLNAVVFGLCIFWFLGASIQLLLYVYQKIIPNFTNTQKGMLLAIAAIGIGLGCFTAGILSKQKVNLRIVFWGGIGTVISLLMLYFLQPQNYLLQLLIFCMAFFSGWFKVPLDAWIQANVKGRTLGTMLAYGNLLSFLFIILASGVFQAIEMYFSLTTLYLFLSVLITLTLLILSKRLKIDKF